MQSKITYVGSFPPPYGGVTVKNALLYKHLSSKMEIEKLDLSQTKRLKPRAVQYFIRTVLSRNGALVIGVSADWQRRLTDYFYYSNKQKMHRSILIVMGGRTPDDKAYIARMNGFKRVYVETESMKHSFEELGARNVAVYPNCRERPVIQVKPNMSRAEGMSSVYFSLISPDKGANIVLDTARILPRMDFHFYGPIEKGYEERFLALVACNSNVYYHGVFPSDSINVVDELKKYDVHLFPTQCPNEGVPGVIVETKMAGLPTVASDRGFNRELITDGVDGILTHDDTAYELASVLGSMLVDPEYVYRMKVAALDSACQFDINQNIDLILKDLSRE